MSSTPNIYAQYYSSTVEPACYTNRAKQLRFWGKTEAQFGFKHSPSDRIKLGKDNSVKLIEVAVFPLFSGSSHNMVACMHGPVDLAISYWAYATQFV